MSPRGKVCRHCGSPSRGNPCWYYDRHHPRFSRDMTDEQWDSFKANCDPDCYGEDYQETIEENRRANMRIALGVLIFGALLCLVVVLSMSRARAHDGYPFECCDQRHCKPIDAPSRQGAHWVLPDGRRFLAGTTRHSSEIGKRGFHLCDWNAGDAVPSNYEPTKIVQPKGKPVCLFVPDAEH